MKKVVSLILGIIVLLTLAGCSKTNTITLDLDGGTGVATIEADSGSDITAPVITKDGYTLDGWYEEDTYTTEFVFSTMPDEAITIYAKWAVAQFTITFELNGGTGIMEHTADFGETVSLADPVKEGATFGGWSYEGCIDYCQLTTIPSENVTYTAFWLPQTYVITLELDGGVGAATVESLAGLAISAPDPEPTKEGYTFNGWYTTPEYTAKYLFYIMNAEDFSLYAKWSIVEYNITLSTSTLLATASKVKGDIVDNKLTYTIATPPAVTGFVFDHWQVVGTTVSISDDASFTYSVTEDVALEAIYSEIYVPVEPELYYETGFEDGQKQSYATGEVVLSDETWNFADALVGNLLTDLTVSGNSARIREGNIETKFAVAGIAQVVFYAGTYTNDSNATVTFDISVDGTTWITVDSFTSTGTLEEYSYVFNETVFADLSLNPNDAYYMRITSSADGRTNVDDFQIYTGEGELIDHSPLYTITFTEDMEYSYLIGDTVDLTDCVATHKDNGPTTCDIIGTVDSSIPGSYEILYYKIDEAGNTAAETVTITIVNEDTTDYLTLDMIPYYDDAEGLFGSSLMDALHAIVNDGFQGVTYGEARYILDDSDRDPNNANNVILVYRATSVSGTWNCSSGCIWNREHVWPQSLLGVDANNGAVNQASDLYNLMPANPSENSSRGNSPYSEMGLGYEPRDEVKGDVARALFYMMIMYDNLNLVDDSPSVYEMGYLSELLQWHLNDPVDDFEINRMEVIFSEQDNRNPFVDYPHFVELIWFSE